MNHEKPGNPERVVTEIDKEIKTYRPIQRMLLIDVLGDRESRPIILWAGILLLVGVFVYHRLEGWSYLDALYFCVISLATVGYGDLTPTTPLAKVFTIFYVINGIGILVGLFDRIRVVRSRQLLRDVSKSGESKGPPAESP